MKRIIFLVARLIYRVPNWLYKIRYYNKNLDQTTFEERFSFAQKMIRKINSKTRVTIHCFGKENIPEEQGCLFTPNHQGLFDALILFECLDRPFKAVLKKELMNVFVLKDVIRLLEFDAIDRDNLRASVKTIKKVTKGMESGIDYVIFPEGTRCKKKNQMLEFKGGTYKTAIDSHKPIVPVALIDCYKVFDNNSIAPAQVQIHFLKPLFYDDYKEMTSTEIAKYVQSQIAQCIEENENKYK